MTMFGYAGVSTDGQTVAAQVAQLRAAGAAKVYSETASGAASNRPELRKVLRVLQPGDVLIVTRLDRLARSTRDLLNILHQFGDQEIGFKSLVDTWADTTTPHGRLMLTVLGGLADIQQYHIHRLHLHLAQCGAGSIGRVDLEPHTAGDFLT